jgi:hypothetical protein
MEWGRLEKPNFPELRVNAVIVISLIKKMLETTPPLRGTPP